MRPSWPRAGLWLCVLAGLLAGVAAAWGASPRAEAVFLTLEADQSDPQTLRARDDAVDAIERILATIRAGYPETQRISAAAPGFTSLILQVKEDAVQSICGAARSSRPIAVTSLSIPDLDAITARVSGTYSVNCGVVRWVLVKIGEPLHVPSLLQLYRRSPSVVSAQNNDLMGPGGSVTVERDGQLWRVVFYHGWGDCMAGCINRRYLFFRAESDGSVAKAGEWSRVDGRESGSAPWTPRGGRR